MTDAALIDEALGALLASHRAAEVDASYVADPIPRRSAVNLNSVERVSAGVLVNRLGGLADTRIRAICAALEVAVDCSR